MLSKDKDLIRVHYNGWSTSFDERIDVTNPSRFIYPERTFTEKRSKKATPATASPMTGSGGIETSQSRKSPSTKSGRGGSPQSDNMGSNLSSTAADSNKIRRLNGSENVEEKQDCGNEVFLVEWKTVIDAYQKEFDEHYDESMELSFVSGQKTSLSNKRGWSVVSLLDSILQWRSKKENNMSRMKFCGSQVLAKVTMYNSSHHVNHI